MDCLRELCFLKKDVHPEQISTSIAIHVTSLLSLRHSLQHMLSSMFNVILLDVVSQVIPLSAIFYLFADLSHVYPAACHRVIQEHAAIAHSSGGKMIALDSPEDIVRWREARRLNWPSKENLKRKMDELQDKQSRGELLPSEREAKAARHKACSSWQVRPSNINPSAGRISGNSSMLPETDGQHHNDSLSSLLAYSSDSSDSSPLIECKGTHLDHSEAPELGSSRTVSSTVNVVEPDSLKSNTCGSRTQKRICKFFANGHCSKGRRCKFVHESGGKSEIPKSDGYQYHGNVVRRGPGLLSKLLSSENDRETSRILQCLRHLVSSGRLQ